MEITQDLAILADYEQSGAVRQVPWEGTLHLVPWFILRKPEPSGEKLRLIADCRTLNRWFSPKTFRLDHLQSILPFLRKGQWAGKIDLKDAYFHLSLGEKLCPYIRMAVGDSCWEFKGGCFGPNVLPQKFMSVMTVLEKVWRAQGILIFVHLDDLLNLGETL